MNTQTIQKLNVENIKGIKHIEIHANDVNEICGENGAGKSSILDSIAFAFGGKKIIDKKALRDGEKNGVINIETDDLIIVRKFNDKGTTLTVRGKKGGTYAQKDLNGIFNMISFDPLEFSRAGKDDQVKIIKEILGEQFNDEMALLTKAHDHFYEERTEIGRQGKMLGDVELPEKVERIDVSDAMNILESMELNNLKCKEEDQEIKDDERTVVDKNILIEDLKVRMIELKKQYKHAVEYVVNVEKGLTAPKKYYIEDVGPVKEKIKNASDINEKAHQYEVALENVEEKRALRKSYEDKTDELKEIEFKKSELIKNANLPVPGLSLGDDGVTLNEIPIEQISSAEKLLLSTKIACSINSDLKIIMIKDGSLLDSKSFELIKEFSKSNEYQLWIETVGDGKSQDSIKISEGEII